jgi:membrane protein DedA with SNARE-associated domain
MLQALRSPASLVIVCVLLFAEEAGVPIPFAPGEAVLIGAGLLIASGAVPFWLAMPAEFVAVLAGATTGFAWARAVGPERLRALADRLGAGHAFDRVAERLRDAGVGGIAVSRLVPGLRIYTTLAAGAVGIPFSTFIVAVVPAIAAWVATFTLLGVFFGIPAQLFVNRFEAYALRFGVVIALLVGIYLILRRLPWVSGTDRRFPRGPGWKVALAAFVDVALMAVVMALLALLTGLEALEADSGVTAVAVVGALLLVYLVIVRRSVGLTVGEALLRVHYP